MWGGGRGGGTDNDDLPSKQLYQVVELQGFGKVHLGLPQDVEGSFDQQTLFR